MGDVVLGELLRERGLLPTGAPHVDYFIVTVTETEHALGRRMARALRAGGYSVAYAFRSQGVGKQFKEADARGAAHTVVLGPDEVTQGVAVVRTMATGEEQRIPLDELL